MIDIETWALLAQLELEALAGLVVQLQTQLLTEDWLEWTRQAIKDKFRHVTDLKCWRGWLPWCA